MDFHKLIAENFKAEGDKLRIMTEYAEYHAGLESRILVNTGINEETTLPESLRILNALELDGVEIEYFMAPAMRFEFDMSDTFQATLPNAKEILQHHMCETVASQINDELKHNKRIRVGRLLAYPQITINGKLEFFSQYKTF